MADITMCASDNCPLKEDCYRFTADPAELWQSYSCFKGSSREINKPEDCPNFWDNGRRKANMDRGSS